MAPQPSRAARIRTALPGDAEAMAAIYDPVVRDTAISFELVPPGAEEFRARLAARRGFAPCLVHEEGGKVLGFAWGSPFRDRPAYRFTVETSVYVAEGARGRGVGRTLYGVLFPLLEAQGFRTAVAGITLPNPASVRLHEATGLSPVGGCRAVGCTFAPGPDGGGGARPRGPRGADPGEVRSPEVAVDIAVPGGGG